MKERNHRDFSLFGRKGTKSPLRPFCKQRDGFCKQPVLFRKQTQNSANNRADSANKTSIPQTKVLSFAFRPRKASINRFFTNNIE